VGCFYDEHVAGELSALLHVSTIRVPWL